MCSKLPLVPRRCDFQCGERALTVLSSRKRVPVCCHHATTIRTQASTASGGSVADVRRCGAVISVFVCSLFSPGVALHPPPNKQTNKAEKVRGIVAQLNICSWHLEKHKTEVQTPTPSRQPTQRWQRANSESFNVTIQSWGEIGQIWSLPSFPSSLMKRTQVVSLLGAEGESKGNSERTCWPGLTSVCSSPVHLACKWSEAHSFQSHETVSPLVNIAKQKACFWRKSGS